MISTTRILESMILHCCRDMFSKIEKFFCVKATVPKDIEDDMVHTLNTEKLKSEMYRYIIPKELIVWANTHIIGSHLKIGQFIEFYEELTRQLSPMKNSDYGFFQKHRKAILSDFINSKEIRGSAKARVKYLLNANEITFNKISNVLEEAANKTFENQESLEKWLINNMK